MPHRPITIEPPSEHGWQRVRHDGSSIPSNELVQGNLQVVPTDDSLGDINNHPDAELFTRTLQSFLMLAFVQ